jgi:UDP-N-acetylglucosamine 2-epimerase (non-hydrolysing)
LEKQGDLKVATILGTRPEIIRLSCVLPALDEAVGHIIVYTRQSFDYEMSDIFFKELGLRKPDYLLEVRAGTLGKQLANILEQSENVLLKERPDAVLILGDTNSSLSAILAKRLGIQIFHMEAGNRAFDWDVPEEVNRRIVDHISDFNLAYTEHARRNLISEGIHSSRVFVTGSPYPEVFARYGPKIESSQVLNRLGIQRKKYFLVSVHREENVENKARLKELFGSFEHLADAHGVPLVVSLHPRTRKKIADLGEINKLVRLERPFGFLDYVKLEQNALCVLSDSGTLPEEAAVLGCPAVQVRVSTERPEALDAGSVVLSGFNRRTITSAVSMVIEEKSRGAPRTIPRDYLDLNVSSKVVKLILGMASISKFHSRAGVGVRRRR